MPQPKAANATPKSVLALGEIVIVVIFSAFVLIVIWFFFLPPFGGVRLKDV